MEDAFQMVYCSVCKRGIAVENGNFKNHYFKKGSWGDYEICPKSGHPAHATKVVMKRIVKSKGEGL